MRCSGASRLRQQQQQIRRLTGGTAVRQRAMPPVAAVAEQQQHPQQQGGACAALGAGPAAQQQPHGAAGRGAKTLLLVRHGEGWHNLPGFENNLDAHLTPRGWAQTAALQQHLAALQPRLGIELVVVSPLRRTLETAAGVFGSPVPPAVAAEARAAEAAVAGAHAGDGGGVGGDPQHPWLLMLPQQHRPREVTRSPGLFLPAVGPQQAASLTAAAGGGGPGDAAAAAAAGYRPLPLLAHEGCRERIGPHVCDMFRDIRQQAADFPGVDFSLVGRERDTEWERLHAAACTDAGVYLSGEEESACEARALEFYRWLMSRPEAVIAVVSHAGFLHHGMRALGKQMLAAWSDTMLAAYGSSAAGPGAPAAPAAVAPAAAEALRLAAGEVAGRIAADWHNCEMRCLRLGWGDAATLLAAPASDCGAAAGGSGSHAARWLDAAPAHPCAWWPGGLHGL